jgi:D-xylonolactonase
MGRASESPWVEVTVPGADRCGEAPAWDEERGRLFWTDIEARQVREYRPRTGAVLTHATPWPVSGIALNRAGGLVLVGPAGASLWQETNEQRLLPALPFNDVVAGPRGDVYAGTLYWGADGMERPGALYRISPPGTVQVVDEGLELSNGLGFSPDGRTLYHADSAARRVYAYDVQPRTGDLCGKRVFAKVEWEDGLPDGLTVDAAGYVWVAL